MHCDPAHLCMSCLSSERDRLRPLAEELGAKLADKLASAIVPDRAWIDSLDERSGAICGHVDQLAQDPVLRVALARICAERARQRLLGML